MTKTNMRVPQKNEDKCIWDNIISKDIMCRYNSSEQKWYYDTRDGFQYNSNSNVKVKLINWVTYGTRKIDRCGFKSNVRKEVFTIYFPDNYLETFDYDIHKVAELQSNQLRGNSFEATMANPKRYVHDIKLLEVETTNSIEAWKFEYDDGLGY